MKKNLLITLGCSMTEGVGCYDYSINPKRELYFNLPSDAQHLTRERFHKNGWPNRVGKALGFDKVLNASLGGSSNSGQLKVFVDRVLPEIEELKKIYDIYVIWMMTDPNRFSFYTEKMVRNFHPVQKAPLSSLEKSYVTTFNDFLIGPAREQAHIIKLSEYVFESNKIKVLYTSWSDTFEYVYSIYPSSNFISPYPDDQIYNFTELEICNVDGHPNEKGYIVIANNIVNLIDSYRPEFRVKAYSNTKLDWEYIGDPYYEYKQYAVRKNPNRLGKKN